MVREETLREAAVIITARAYLLKSPAPSIGFSGFCGKESGLRRKLREISSLKTFG